MAEYDTAPDVAMGTVPEFGLDNQLFVEFFVHPTVDELLSNPEVGFIHEKHPRVAELEKLGRLDGPAEDMKHHLRVSPADRIYYKDEEFIRIIKRGEKETIHEVPLDTHKAGARCLNPTCHKNRFADRYNRWKAGLAAETGGYPLSKVPGLTPSQLKEFEQFNVFTAEQLIALDEGVGSKFSGIHALQDRVRTFLAAMDNRAKHDELAKRDERIAALERQLNEMLQKAQPQPQVSGKK